ncbi:MAG: F0F1 ATP synthase subunit B [Verrucomicrobiota bacterium]
MNTLFLASAAPAGEPGVVQQIVETFGWTPTLFFSQVVSFCIVAFLLHRFAYKPILTVLEERRQKIAEGLANAEKIKQELANAQVKAQEIMTKASAEATKAIEEARAAAAKVQEQETQKAIAAANDIIAKAKQASEAELIRMKAELRKEVGRLVVATSAKVTGGILTAEQQGRLAEETNKQLAAN